MEPKSSAVENHYSQPFLLEEILLRLRQRGIDTTKLSRADISSIDEFHVRGAEVSLSLAQHLKKDGARVLDVGCGIGGPARMLADDYACQVIGIDLSSEFIRAAQKLTELVGLSEKIAFLQADATRLPFEDESFDVVWTQHVQMNIEDKEKFYSEIYRVLLPEGQFLYYDIFSSGDAPPDYPVPWAEDASISFLRSAEAVHQVLQQLGFETVRLQDETEAGIRFFERLLEQPSTPGPSGPGLNILMGESTEHKLHNLLKALKSGALKLESGVFLK